MPSVGGLALGDQNNCWRRSASQENNNVSSLPSAVTLTSGLRLLHTVLGTLHLVQLTSISSHVDHPGEREWKGYKRFY